MATNPNHLAIFKAANAEMIAVQQKLFDYVVNTPTNTVLAAREGDQLVGIMCYTPSEYCQLRPLQLLSILPGMALALGRRLLPVLQWRMNWKRHDHPQPHIHFGPLAVDPQHQGKGIGKAMLRHFCHYADQLPATAYLETDKKENVPLYERFGFRVVAEDTLFGVPNWFMVREPGPTPHLDPATRAVFPDRN
ncbi:hypothetical protein GCM10028803_58290 [Larkinella knui]